MLFVLQDGLLSYQSYGSSYRLALLNISLPFGCTESLHHKEQKNSGLENKERDVGFFFCPQRLGGGCWAFRDLAHFYRAATCAVVGVNICASQQYRALSSAALPPRRHRPAGSRTEAWLGAERLPPKPNPALEGAVPAAQGTTLAASAWQGAPGNADAKGCQPLAAKLLCCVELRAG